jgi:hypothetical protein
LFCNENERPIHRRLGRSDQTQKHLIHLEGKLDLHWQQTVNGSINGRDFVYDKGMLLLNVSSSVSEENDLIEMYEMTSNLDDVSVNCPPW